MITRNAVRCNSCGAEVESTHRHDFQVHFCPHDPRKPPEGQKSDWLFAVDGGKAYLRRVGGGFTDISEGADEGE